MKLRRLAILMGVVIVFAACTGRHESVTGGYGDGLLTGQVTLHGASPAGIEVSVRGTGMKTMVAEDGTFVFAGVPDGVHLDFHRASDGIDTSITIEDGSGPVLVEIVGNAARKSSRRRSVSRGRERVYEFEGVIRTAAADGIVVFTSKREEVPIVLGPDTVIRKGERRLTAADLLAGTRVHVKASKAGELYTALEVKVQEGDEGEEDDPPAVREYEGIVRSATATELVVFTSHNEEVTFVITPETEIRKGNAPIAPADVQVDWRVHVKATSDATAGTNTATRVIVQNTNESRDVEIEGTVASVDATSLVVTTFAGDITVQTMNGTQIRRNNTKIALGDVAVGSRVEVEGRSIDATTIEAKKITVED